MTRRFGRYPGNTTEGIPTAADSYRQGYDTGLKWKESYIPGGPHIMGPRNYHTVASYAAADWAAYCDATVENNAEWHRGFKDGRIAQENTA
jgi:hypothetical protein